jgi:hypothetical protein
MPSNTRSGAPFVNKKVPPVGKGREYVTSAKPLIVQGGVGDAVGEGDAAGDAAGEAAGAGAVCAEVAANDAATMAASKNIPIKTLRKKYLSLLN